VRCIRYHGLKNDSGSAVTGFALVAPLVIGVFIVVIQIGSVLADRATLMLATQTGVRIASTLNGTNTQGKAKALSVLDTRGMAKNVELSFADEQRGSMHYKVCKATSRIHLSWLGQDVTFTSVARAIDEQYL